MKMKMARRKQTARPGMESLGSGGDAGHLDRREDDLAGVGRDLRIGGPRGVLGGRVTSGDVPYGNLDGDVFSNELVRVDDSGEERKGLAGLCVPKVSRATWTSGILALEVDGFS